jgi:hypothetical protein
MKWHYQGGRGPIRHKWNGGSFGMSPDSKTYSGGQPFFSEQSVVFPLHSQLESGSLQSSRGVAASPPNDPLHRTRYARR